jgi:hypothetical protein
MRAETRTFFPLSSQSAQAPHRHIRCPNPSGQYPLTATGKGVESGRSVKGRPTYQNLLLMITVEPIVGVLLSIPMLGDWLVRLLGNRLIVVVGFKSKVAGAGEYRL